jgi:hypothetical protein
MTAAKPDVEGLCAEAKRVADLLDSGGVVGGAIIRKLTAALADRDARLAEREADSARLRSVLIQLALFIDDEMQYPSRWPEAVPYLIAAREAIGNVDVEQIDTERAASRDRRE